MSMRLSNRKQREQHLIGNDSAPLLRQGLKELRDYYQTERRKAEVDGKEGDVRLDVPVLAVELPSGRWKIETTSTVFEGQDGTIEVADVNERVAMAEFRWKLAGEMTRCRWCTPNDARRYAARANVHVVGRIPYQRIVSK